MITKGFSLIELIIAIAVFVVLISGVTFLAVGSYDAFYGKGNNREVERLAQEAIEVVKIIKERSWTAITEQASDSPSSIQIQKNANGNWEFAAGTETRGAFTRDIKIYNVTRDGSGNILASGGINDPSTRKVVVTISATGRTDYVAEAYVTNWESFRMEQTTWAGSANINVWLEGQDDFSTSTNMSMGDTVTLGAGS